MNRKQKNNNTKVSFTVAVIPSMEYKFHCYVMKSEGQNQNVTITHLYSHATFQPGQNESTGTRSYDFVNTCCSLKQRPINYYPVVIIYCQNNDLEDIFCEKHETHKGVHQMFLLDTALP